MGRILIRLEKNSANHNTFLTDVCLGVTHICAPFTPVVAPICTPCLAGPNILYVFFFGLYCRPFLFSQYTLKGLDCITDLK